MVRASEGARDRILGASMFVVAFLTGCAGGVTGSGLPDPGEGTDVPTSGVINGGANTTASTSPPTTVLPTTSTTRAEPEPPVEIARTCWNETPSDAPIAAARSTDSPQGLSNVLARISHTDTFVYGDLAYEGNNADVRGAPDSDGMYDLSGATVAARWHDIAEQVDRLFVLRDSLWSQQDHPYRHAEPCALMLPPNWITAAVELVDPIPLTVPPADDDEAWATLAADEADVYGTFPPSEALHRVATATPSNDAERRATTNARATLRLLAAMADRLLAKRGDNGADAAVQLGAELIARGDVTYFGTELRRSTVVPILVPNVLPKEIEEGKGFGIPGVAVADDRLRDIEQVVFERRLRDGDIALERYDLTNQADRELAITMLERLIPDDGEDGATVWVWINGRLDPNRKLRGEDPTAYVADFRQQLAAADINLSRLDFISKPVVEVETFNELLSAAERYESLGLPLSVTLTPVAIAGLER